MSYTTYLSDSFDRANSILRASVPDNALGGSASSAWVAQSDPTDNCVVLSNQATKSDGAQHVLYTSGSAVADQLASIVTNTSAVGCVIRCGTGTGDGNGYLGYRNTSNNLQVFRINNGSFTQLGSNGSTTIVNGDTISIEVDSGFNLIGRINGGAAEITTSDGTSAFATGLGGIFWGGSADGLINNYIWKTLSTIGRPVKMAGEWGGYAGAGGGFAG